MRVVILDRGVGKTKKIIEWMVEGLQVQAPRETRIQHPLEYQAGLEPKTVVEPVRRMLVAHSRSAAMSALAMYRQMVRTKQVLDDPMLETWQFISVQEMMATSMAGQLRRLGYLEIAFDNADIILSEMASRIGTLGLITMTGNANDMLVINNE